MASGQAKSQYSDIKEIRKALFKSPGGSVDTPDAMKMLLNRLQIEHDVDVSLKVLQKEEHEKRLSDLRKLKGDLQFDAWKYKPIEELIGLQ